MSTYAIGDVQGCFDQLQALLIKINFEPEQDELWFVGDLVNRGPKSLDVLHFVKNLPHKQIVLGNHDLHLLALVYGYPYAKHTLNDILSSSELDQYVEWLQQLPLLHHDEKLNYVMVHAGIYPFWDLQQAKRYAQELQATLQMGDIADLLENLYGDKPDYWQDNLTGWDRLRFITNVFTRMRFCGLDGRLEFKTTDKADLSSEEFLPWYKIPERKTKDVRIIFGHWAALQGKADVQNVFALDTGCVWGNCLTAMRLEDQQRFSVPCHK